MNRKRDWDKWPFRTIATGPEKDFPVINNYGHAAYSDSPTYYAPHKGASVGTYPIANAMMFGNM